MSQFIAVYSTFASLNEAKVCARIVVSEKLCACANISRELTSIYNWNDKIEESEEVAVIFKTTADNYKKLESKIKEMHSYANPCVVSFEILEGSGEYLDWIRRSVV